MPLLAGLLQSLFGALAAWFTKVVVARVGLRVAAVVAIGTAGTALLLFFNGQIAPLLAAAFSTDYGQVIGLAFPPIAGTCLATIGATWTACMLYRLKVSAVKLTANV